MSRKTLTRGCTQAHGRSQGGSAWAPGTSSCPSSGPSRFHPLGCSVTLGPWFGNRVLPNPVGCVAQWPWSHGVTLQGSSLWKNSMKTKFRILQTPLLASAQALHPLLAHVPSPTTSTSAEARTRRRHSPSCKVEPGPAWTSLALKLGTTVEGQLQQSTSTVQSTVSGREKTGRRQGQGEGRLSRGAPR